MITYIEDQEFDTLALALRPDQRYEDCTFNRCQFEGKNAHGAAFLDAEFSGCDLSNIDVAGADFRNCKFKGCKLIGINWALARRLEELSFEDCDLTLCGFGQLELAETAFSDCQLKEVDFRDTVLKRATFTGCDLKGTLFEGANLTGASLSSAKNYSIDVRQTTITDASFSLPEALSLLEGLGIRLT